MRQLGFLIFVATLASLVPLADAAVLNIDYTVTDNTIADGTASGTIRDNGNQIGTWSISSFAFTLRSSTVTYTPTVGTVTTSTPDNSYGKSGIGILISAGSSGTRETGVMSILYTVSCSLNSGYSLDSASFWGKYPGTVGQYGPAWPTGNGGSIRLSGFAGQGTVSDPVNTALNPTDNLFADDGYQFSSGEDLGGWRPVPGPVDPVNSPDGIVSHSAANVRWQLTAPAAGSYTFSLDYSSQPISSANEATAFNFNVVPEPSVSSLFLLGLGLVVRRRRRLKREVEYQIGL